MKIHLSVGKELKDGGYLITSLCGRENRQSDDGMNISADRSEVTCKFCQAIMTNPKHWAYRKWNL